MFAESMPSTETCNGQERTKNIADLYIIAGATSRWASRHSMSMDSMWALQPAGQEQGTPGNSEAFLSAVMGGIQTAWYHSCAQI